MMVAPPARPQHLEGLLGGDLGADGLDGAMHLALGQLLHLLDRVAVANIDDVGGAELGGELQLHRIVVDGDDAAGADDRRPIDRRHADAAAADQRRERHVLADLHDGILVHQHLLGKGRRLGSAFPLLSQPP